MKKIGIIGLGLIGGSLARAIRKSYPNTYIAAVDNSEESLEHALKDRVINEYSLFVNEIFGGADIVFACTPVSGIAGQIADVVKYVPAECIITDVGSTKGGIYEQIKSLGQVCYIGGHPMAGSEKIGYENSSEKMFNNAYYILTPLPGIAEEKISLMEELVRGIGAKPIVMDAQTHDFIAAAISHAPHVIASALVNMVSGMDDGAMHLLAGGGFKDITRIASSSPEMWRSISFANKAELLKAINEFKKQLSEFENHLIKGNSIEVYEFFENAKIYRDRI